jgi:hypothetical protein
MSSRSRSSTRGEERRVAVEVGVVGEERRVVVEVGVAGEERRGVVEERRGQTKQLVPALDT